MAEQQSASNALTIRRLRNGDNLILRLAENGKPLFQSITDTGTPVPDWSQSTNQPAITASVTSTRGNAVTIISVVWAYNGITLTFDSTGACTTSGYTSTFKTTNNGATLNIINNLASKTNTAADNIDVTVVAQVAGVEYTLTGGKTVTITPMSSAGYVGVLSAASAYLDTDNQQTTVTAQLYQDGQPVQQFYIMVYRNGNSFASGDTQGNGFTGFNVARANVDGEQVFVVDFKLDSVSGTTIARQSIRIADISDEYQLVLSITSANKEVSEGNNVTVAAQVYKTTAEGVMSDITSNIDASNFTLEIIQPTATAAEPWKVLATAAAKQITVTTDHTDANGEQRDVEVVGTVKFTDTTTNQ
jgi:hypothetical protein